MYDHLHDPWPVVFGFPRTLRDLAVVLADVKSKCKYSEIGIDREGDSPNAPRRAGRASDVCAGEDEVGMLIEGRRASSRCGFGSSNTLE